MGESSGGEANVGIVRFVEKFSGIGKSKMSVVRSEKNREIVSARGIESSGVVRVSSEFVR